MVLVKKQSGKLKSGSQLMFKGIRGTFLLTCMLLAAGWSRVGYGQNTQPKLLKLGEAINIALENNYGIQIVQNEARIAANNHTLGNAGFFPAVSAQASQTRSIEDNRTSYSSENFPDSNIRGARSTNTVADVSLSWTLFDGLRMVTSYERLGELNTLGHQQARLQVEQTVAQIIAVYFDIIRQKKSYTVLENTLEVSEERVRVAETKLDLGSGSEYDMLQARADLNADEAALMRQEVQLENAKIQLNELLGRAIKAPFEVTDDIPLEEQLAYPNLLQNSLSNNLELTVARTNLKVSELDLQEIRGERLPELEFNVGYGYSKSESGAGFIEFNQSDGLNYGLTARFNLFDGFDVNRRTQNARINIKNRELAVDQQRHQLEAEISRIYRGYANSLSLVDLESENLKYAEQSLEIALERFRLGTINSIELREAQRTLISAENRLIQAQYEAKVAETELLRISGMLTGIES